MAQLLHPICYRQLLNDKKHKMEAYKFETTVLENGVIQIPEIAKYKNQKVQIFLIPDYSVQEEKNNEQHVEEFINTWVGYFSDIETDDIRYNAIMKKEK